MEAKSAMKNRHFAVENLVFSYCDVRLDWGSYFGTHIFTGIRSLFNVLSVKEAESRWFLYCEELISCISWLELC